MKISDIDPKGILNVLYLPDAAIDRNSITLRLEDDARGFPLYVMAPIHEVDDSTIKNELHNMLNLTQGIDGILFYLICFKGRPECVLCSLPRRPISYCEARWHEIME